MQLFAKFKQILYMAGVQSTLNFRKFKVAIDYVLVALICKKLL